MLYTINVVKELQKTKLKEENTYEKRKGFIRNEYRERSILKNGRGR